MISREHRLFLKRWLHNPMQMGAIAPSSRQLADAMARLVPKGGSGCGGRARRGHRRHHRRRCCVPASIAPAAWW